MIIRNWGGVARYGLPGLILGAVVSWIGGARGPEAAAQTGVGGDAAIQASPAQEPVRGQPARPLPQPLASGEAGGTLAFVTTAGGTSGQWLYLIDTKARAFAVYRVDPMNPKGSVKLEAARQYEWDLKLEHYNNQAPEPSAIEATVKAMSQTGRTPRDR